MDIQEIINIIAYYKDDAEKHINTAQSKEDRCFWDGNRFVYNVMLNLITAFECYAEAMLNMKGD